MSASKAGRGATAKVDQVSQAEANAKRLLAPENVSIAMTGMVGGSKQIEEMYLKSGAIPEGGYMFVGRQDAAHQRGLTENGYRRLIDPDTGNPVNTEHGDPCFWREKALQNRHVEHAADVSRSRLNQMDAAYGQTPEASDLGGAAGAGDLGVEKPEFTSERVSSEKIEEALSG